MAVFHHVNGKFTLLSKVLPKNSAELTYYTFKIFRQFMHLKSLYLNTIIPFNEKLYAALFLFNVMLNSKLQSSQSTKGTSMFIHTSLLTIADELFNRCKTQRCTKS